MAAASSSDGCYPVGRDLGVGCTVRLCHLNSAKGKQLNDQVGMIEAERENRYEVKLQVKKGDVFTDSEKEPVLIKPMNLRLLCNACYKDNARLKSCAGCATVWYCGTECQRIHWKDGGHRQVCVGRRKNVKHSDKETNEQVQHETDGKWLKSMDHPSWATKLSQKQRQALRQYHIQNGCSVAWPVSAETDAMLELPNPCFLACHPNMRFGVSIADLPGGFTMSYDRPIPHGVDGKKAPMGRRIAMLREIVPQSQSGVQEYFKKVPLHAPVQLVFGIVADQVLWTKYDYDDMNSFYKNETSQRFNWPGVECVGVCPGTNKVVPFSMTEKHLLVVTELQGAVYNKNTRKMNVYRRVMPRILTKEGYENMLGPKGNENRLVRLCGTRFSCDGVRNIKGSMELYPDALGKMKERSTRDGGLVNFSAKYRDQGVPLASTAYSDFHESGMYLSFERLCEDERAEQNPHGQTVGGVRIEHGNIRRGLGKSQY